MVLSTKPETGKTASKMAAAEKASTGIVCGKASASKSPNPKTKTLNVEEEEEEEAVVAEVFDGDRCLRIC